MMTQDQITASIAALQPAPAHETMHGGGHNDTLCLVERMKDHEQ
jgi:hypothetical protein